MAGTVEQRSAESKTAAAVMAMAGRSARACDVCGRDRARWYCAADEAYLCGRCDNSIHCANALALRHERVRLGPNGAPCKGGDRSPASAKRSSTEPLLGGQKKIKGEKHHLHPKLRMIKDEMLAQSFFSNHDDTRVPGYPESPSETEDAGHALPQYVPELPATGGEPGVMSPTDEFPSMEVPQEFHYLERGDEDTVGGSDDEYLDIGDIVTEADFLDENGEEGSGFNQDGCKSEYNLAAVKNESFDHVQTGFGELLDSSNVKTEKNVSLLYPFQDFSGENQKSQVPSLKLNYEDVLSAWSGRGPLWTEDGGQNQTVPIFSSMDVSLNLDLESFPREQVGEVPVLGGGDEGLEVGGGREARVMRYREKRRTRLFSKQIRYEVRKLNAERRPRMKGRFVKRLPS